MYDTIVLAIDGSDEATTALEHAICLATSVGATVNVLTVVESTGNPMKFGVAEVDELNRAAEGLVDDVVAAHAGKPVEVRGDVRRGRPNEVILDYAEEVDADLLVVGRRGADGVTGAILGSTTDRLARKTDRPLTIVPLDGDAEAPRTGG